MVILQKAVAGTSAGSLDRFVARAKRAVGLRGAVTVLVTSSRALRALNGRFRGKDKPTDVLSFPAEAVRARRFAGDVAISAEIAAENAQRFGHSPADEVKILALHGMLHLAGYDHEADQGEMAGKEIELRSVLGLPAALMERSRHLKDRLKGRVPKEKPQTSRASARAKSARAARTSASRRLAR